MSRPMDGSGTLRRRGPDGQPLEDYFGGAEVHGGYWVQLVDAWPHGRLQAQLDRIEANLGFANRLIVLPDAESNRWAAFTDDELDGLLDSFYQAQPRNGQVASDLRREIKAELERRRA